MVNRSYVRLSFKYKTAIGKVTNATKMQSVLIQASRNRLLEERFGKFIVVLAKLVLSETE